MNMQNSNIHPIEIARTPDSIITWAVTWLGEVTNVPYWIPNNIFTELYDDVLKIWTLISSFDEDRNILHWFYSDYICIEYTEPQIREKDKMNNQSHYELVNLFQSKKQDEQGRQFSKNVWEFEYNGKYYLVVSPRNTPLPQNDIISERWIFKWVIVDMEKYNATKSKPEIIESQVAEKVEAIFPHNI